MRFIERAGLVLSIGCGFLVGCIVAEALPTVGLIWILVAGLIICLFFVWPQIIIRTIILIAIGIVIGIWCWQAAYQRWQPNLPFGESVTVNGWVDSMPQVSSTGMNAIVKVKSIKIGNDINNKTDVKIAVNFSSASNLQYGQAVNFNSTLQPLTTTPQFDGLRYWRVRGAQAQAFVADFQINRSGVGGNWVYKQIYQFKTRLTNRMSAIVPGDEGSLLLGILFGDQGSLSKEIKDQFKQLGISHLTAVSGYNLTIIALWPILLAGFIPKRWALALSVIIVLLFVIFTGAPSSINRAAIMALVMIVGKYIGRPPHSLILIVLTAAVMGAINPFAVKDDAGFVLSFLAFFGLVEIGPLLKPVCRVLKFPLFINLMSETLGAQFMALPYLLGAFGQLSIIAPLTNLLILPLIPAIMLVGLLVVVIGLIPMVATAKIAALIYYPMHGFLAIIGDISRLPFISAAWPKGGYFPWFLGVIIIGWWLASKMRSKTSFVNT